MREAIIGRLDAREDEFITKRAQLAVEREQGLVAETTDSAIVRHRAVALGNRLLALYERQHNPGFLRRILKKQVLELVPFRAVNYGEIGEPAPAFSTRPPKKINYRIMQEGIRTPSFDEEQSVHEGRIFRHGWTVGMVTKRTLLRMARAHVHPQEPTDGPYRIWRRVTELDSGEAADKLEYEIDGKTGQVYSFTNEEQDDQFVSLEKQAGTHALALINRTIKYLDS